MSALQHDGFLDRLPTEIEIRNAEQLRKVLAAQIREGAPTRIELAQVDGKPQTITLMPALANSLLDILRLISNGMGFRMIPVEAELTTQQAADLLNVSRPFLIKLLDNGEIPFTKTGRHRRVKAVDLFAFKEKRDGQRGDALSRLAKLDEEADLL